MGANWSWWCQFYLSFDMSTCHRTLRTFHPFSKNCTRELFVASTVVSDIHYRRARVAFEGTSFRNHIVTHQIIFWSVPTQETTVAAQDIVNPSHCATTSCSILAPTPHFPCNHLVHAASIHTSLHAIDPPNLLSASPVVCMFLGWNGNGSV